MPATTFVDEMGQVRPLTPIQVRPDGPVIGSALRLIQPMSMKYVDGPPEVPRGTVTSYLSERDKVTVLPPPQPKTELAELHEKLTKVKEGEMETPGNPQDKPEPQPKLVVPKQNTATKKKKALSKPKPVFQPEVESGWFCCAAPKKKY